MKKLVSYLSAEYARDNEDEFNRQAERLQNILIDAYGSNNNPLNLFLNGTELIYALGMSIIDAIKSTQALQRFLDRDANLFDFFVHNLHEIWHMRTEEIDDKSMSFGIDNDLEGLYLLVGRDNLIVKVLDFKQTDNDTYMLSVTDHDNELPLDDVMQICVYIHQFIPDSPITEIAKNNPQLAYGNRNARTGSNDIYREMFGQ